MRASRTGAGCGGASGGVAGFRGVADATRRGGGAQAPPGVLGEGVPGFVYGIFVSLFILFNCFALNQWLQYRRKGRFADYLYGEKVFVVLSLVAKTLLAWQVFAGTLN